MTSTKAGVGAPSGEQLSGAFDRIVGRELAADLAVLFDSVALNLAALIHDAHFPQIQEYLSRFLFGPGYQEIGVQLSERGSKVVMRHEETKNTSTTFPNILLPGDMDVVSQFFPTRIENSSKGHSNVNEFDAFVGMCGMPPLEFVVQKLRELIVCGSDGGKAQKYPGKMAASLLQALKLTFPNGNALAMQIINLESVELDYEPCPSGGGLLASVRAEMNMDNLAKEYPAMANLLKHLADLEVSIIDIHAPNSAPEKDVHSAPCMMQVRIVYVRGAVELRVHMMLAADGRNRLVWFDRAKGRCALDSKGRPIDVDFQESEAGYLRSFRVVIDGTFRIPQLGCGSIALPLLVIQLRCTSTKTTFPTPYTALRESPAHRFDITILHMTDKWLTALLLRPFFNLDLLRFILLHHFHMQMEILPSVAPAPLSVPSRDGVFAYDDDFDEFFDARDEEETSSVHEELRITHPPVKTVLPVVSDGRRHWIFTSKVHMFLPLPPKVITSCLSLFVGEQLSSPDDIRMMIDLMTALAGDLKLMSARLAGEPIDAALKDGSIVKEAVQVKLSDVLPSATKASNAKQPKKRGGLFGCFKV